MRFLEECIPVGVKQCHFFIFYLSISNVAILTCLSQSFVREILYASVDVFGSILGNFVSVLLVSTLNLIKLVFGENDLPSLTFQLGGIFRLKLYFINQRFQLKEGMNGIDSSL